MSEQEILTAAQRQDLITYAGADSGSTLDDSALLGLVADRIGMTGELAVDPDGVVELMRDDVLVVLESVPPDDADLVDHPDLLHLAVLLRTDDEAEREALVRAQLLDPAEPGEQVDEEWSYAWWGSMCTRLPRETGLATQMEALHAVINEAEAVVEGRAIGTFLDNLAWLRCEDDDELDDDLEEEDRPDDDDGMRAGSP